MSDFITLRCPSCGAKLEPAQNTKTLTCAYCGSTHSMRQVVTGMDKVAAELAIPRLEKEIATLTQHAKAVEQGIPAVWKPGFDWFPIMGALFIVGWFAVGFGYALDSIILAGSGAIAIITAVIVILVQDRKRSTSLQQTRQQIKASIQQEIDKKRTLLQQHRQILDSF